MVEEAKILKEQEEKRLEKKVSKLYNKKSSSYYAYENKKFNSCIPNSILKQFNLNRKNIFIQIIKLTPGNFIPPHYDRYNNYKTKHNITKKQKVIRIWIALSNPKFGHALFLDDDVIYDIPIQVNAANSPAENLLFKMSIKMSILKCRLFKMSILKCRFLKCRLFQVFFFL